MLSKIINFITVDIWRIRLKDFSRSKSLFIKQLRIIILALRGFDEDKCFLRASALTFYSLLAIVPVVAMAFGVAKGFGFQKVLAEQLLHQFPGQEEVMIKIMDFAQSLLENTEGGLVAGIGVVVLFWAVIKVLSNIEDSFNNIWGIKKSRTWGRKLSDYLSLMLVCPVLLIVSGSITVLVTTQLEFILGKISFLSTLNPIIFSVLNLLPYSVLWILFTFVYKFMPNIKVKFTSALLAGVVAGTIYEVVQWGYIAFQVGMSKYNAIYGGFAALPLFLVWLQLSWLIVLLGAELSFAHQNVDQYELEPDCLRVSVSFKRLLSLRITHLLVKNFSGENTLLTATSIAQLLKIPIRLVRQILFELVECGIASEVKTNEQNDSTYQPARDAEKLTIKYVIDALEHRGIDALPITQTRELDVLSKSLEELDTVIEESPANKSLKDI